MIINKFLQLFSEEYRKTNSINKLVEFTKKTLPSDGTDKIFIGCILIMFHQGFIGASASREYLVSIVQSGKVTIGNTNLLNFYVKRINGNKMVSKYLKDIDKDEEFAKHLDLVLEYLNQFSYDFTKTIKESYKTKITEFLRDNNK